MAIRSGLNAQLGWLAGGETTWGTYEAPDVFAPFVSESLALSDERIETAAIRAGDRVMIEDHWAPNAKGASGSTTFDLLHESVPRLFRYCLGDKAIATPTGGTLTRDHTYTLGDLESTTLQVGRPDTGGTVRPFSYAGAKVVSWTLSQNIDEFAQLEVEWDAQSETTAQSLASASYSADNTAYNFTECNVTVGGAQLCVNSLTLTGNTGIATDRYRICSTGNKREQVAAAMYEISGELTADFEDLDEYNYFVNGTTNQVVITWTDSDANGIESGFTYTTTVTLPVVRWDGATPAIDGPDIVDISMPFKVLADSAGALEPITIVVRTTDTA